MVSSEVIVRVTALCLLLLACSRRPPEPVPNVQAPPPEIARPVLAERPATPAPAAPAVAVAVADPASSQAPPPEQLGHAAEGLGVAPGGPAPDAWVLDPRGAPVRLASLFREPVLLVFHRGGGCPGCVQQVHALAQAAPDFRALGVTPVLVGGEGVTPTALLQATHDVPFPVLADPDLVAHAAWRVVDEAGDHPAAPGARADGRVAVPSAFLVVDGTVRWAHADADPSVRPTPEQLLEAVRAALAG